MKLTKAIREEIVKNAIIKSCLEEEKRLVAEGARLAGVAREIAFSGKREEIEELNKQLGEIKNKHSHFTDLFNVRNSRSGIKFRITDGSVFYLHYNGSFGDLHHRLCDGEDIKTVYHFSPFSKYNPPLILDTRFANELNNWLKCISSLNDLKHEITHQVSAAVGSFTTVKKLVENWPEIEQFLPDLNIPIRGLPAIPIEDINKLLGVGNE